MHSKGYCHEPAWGILEISSGTVRPLNEMLGTYQQVRLQIIEVDLKHQLEVASKALFNKNTHSTLF